MSETPLVSIVTASFNSADYIEAAIRSVAAQDYPNIEHLVIDGGSTDGTVEILKRYDGRVVWVSEPDGGQSDAINKGFRRARGEILGWLDADNIYEPGAVGEAVSRLVREPELGMVYGGVYDVDEAGRVEREYMPPEFTLVGFLLYHEFNFIPPSSVFMRRGALERAGLLDPDLHYTMDFDLWLRMGLRAKVARVKRFWSRFLLRGTSKTGSQMEKFGWDILRVMERFFERRDLPEDVRENERMIRARLYQHAADRIITGDFSRGREYYRRALMAAPMAASGQLWRTTAYLYYRDSMFGRVYRGMKERARKTRKLTEDAEQQKK